MTPCRLALTALAALATAQPTLAQEPLSALQRTVACAVPPMVGPPPQTVAHVLGSQDPVDRTVFGPGDSLVLDNPQRALEVGQQYFVRRPVTHGRPDVTPDQRAVKTSGWLRIAAVDDALAIADIEQACDTVSVGDYLEPFISPDVSALRLELDRSGELVIDEAAHVLFGDDERVTGAIGEFMLIDRGSEEGVTYGTRLAIFRDKALPGLPLAPVGEAIAISVAPHLSLVRILEARDVVMSGDLAAPRR
jgi:hypothetical protein